MNKKDKDIQALINKTFSQILDLKVGEGVIINLLDDKIKLMRIE